MKGHFFHRDELEQRLDSVLNKTLGEVDVNHVFEKTINNHKITGIAGDVIEQSVLGFPADNKQRPDLDVDGVSTELKTTGIRLSKKDENKYEAKEPMSITAVSPKQIVCEVFDSSNFWHKLEHMLLVYYHYSSSKTVRAAEYADFYIRGYEFHEFNADDKARLKSDWEIVRDFIIEIQKIYEVPESQYPRISSELRDKLVYIDTAPKWPNPPRFRLKRQVITNIVQNHFGNSLEQLPGKYTGYRDIDNKCRSITEQNQGKTIEKLITEYDIKVKDINKVSKSIAEPIIIKMFGGQSKKINQIEVFDKFGLIGKTVTLTKAETRTEDMKLFSIDFEEWTDQNIVFEDSMIYDYFANHQLLCMVFEEPSIEAKLTENKFIGFKRLSFNDELIHTVVKKVWEEIRELVNEQKLSEEIVYDKAGKVRINKNGTEMKKLNFPKSKDNVVFVRGSGLDSSVKTEEVNGISMYRQYIWLKGTYVVDALRQLPLL